MLTVQERDLFDGWVHRRHRCFEMPKGLPTAATAALVVALGGFSLGQPAIVAVGALALLHAARRWKGLRLVNREQWQAPVPPFAIEKMKAICSDDTKDWLESYRRLDSHNLLRFSHLAEILVSDANTYERHQELANIQASAFGGTVGNRDWTNRWERHMEVEVDWRSNSSSAAGGSAPGYQTPPAHLNTLQFRDRDGVCILYEVRGIEGSTDFPYRNYIGSLKEAVAIGRTYPGIYGDGAATHIYRVRLERYPEGHEYHHSSRYTHHWRVGSDGHLQPITFYSRSWSTKRLAPGDYASSLPAMSYRSNTLEGQLVDLANVARAIGLKLAADAVVSHVHGWQPLPFKGKRTTR